MKLRDLISKPLNGIKAVFSGIARGFSGIAAGFASLFNKIFKRKEKAKFVSTETAHQENTMENEKFKELNTELLRTVVFDKEIEQQGKTNSSY